MNLGHAEIEELLGAYALDAVDPEEREVIEHHLTECPRCRAEVADHREVASMLAMSGAPAPDGVWDRIVGSIDAELPPSLALPPVLPFPPGAPRATGGPVAAPARRRRRGMVAIGAAVAAVAAALIGVLAVKVVDQGQRIDELEVAGGPGGSADPERQAFFDAWTSPDGRRATLVSADGAVEVRAVITPDGQGYVMADDVPSLPAGQTYQLWGVAGDDVVSLGVLGPDVDVAAFHADNAVAALAITAEDSPGVVTSTQTPTVQGLLS